MSYKILLYFFAFLASTSILYAVCPRKQRYIVLLTSSLIFYTLFSHKAVLLLIITIVTTHYSGIIMNNISGRYSTKGLEKAERKKVKAKVKARKRVVVWLFVLINVGLLLLTKYFNFFSSSFSSIANNLGFHISAKVLHVVLPLGISYYTLQALSYVIDVFRGKYKAEKNILKTALFISFFPQLYEGPFGRYDLLMPQMFSGEPLKIDNFYSGFSRMLWGLFKIFMVSNRISMISDFIFNDYSSFGGISIVIGVIAFTIQLYAEFSGYIDLVSGMAKIFGIDFAKNFDKPFLAENVADFWRRWHISLGSWFRDYIFYPISTSKTMLRLRKSINPKVADFISLTLAMLTVWFLTGLWHGASSKYVVYGLYYFVLILIYTIVKPFVDKGLDKLGISPKNKALSFIRVTKTLVLVLIGMMIFRAANLTVFKNMFLLLFKSGKQVVKLTSILDIQDLVVLVISFVVMLLPVIFNKKGACINDKYIALTPYKKYWVCFGAITIIIIFGAYGFGYLPPDPIYGGF